MWLLKYSAFPLHFPVSCVSYARTAAWVFTEPETRIWVLVIYLQGSGKVGIEIGTWYWAPKITADGDCRYEIKRCLLLGRKVYDQPREHIKKQRHYFANKGPSSQGCAFSGGHVWM